MPKFCTYMSYILDDLWNLNRKYNVALIRLVKSGPELQPCFFFLHLFMFCQITIENAELAVCCILLQFSYGCTDKYN